MKGYSELLEAKIERNVTSLAPAAPAERHFVDLHKIKDDISDPFLVPDNGIFNSSKPAPIKKEFNRSKNRYGRDMDQSIKSYDENITLADRLPNAHKKLKVRHIMDKDGNVIDSDPNSKNNKQALLNVIKRAAGKRKHKLVVVKESDKKEEFKPGDNVHLGLRTKGGAGFRGKFVSVDEHGKVTIERPKDELDKYYPRTIKGHVSLVTKEMIGEELNKKLLSRYSNRFDSESFSIEEGSSIDTIKTIKPIVSPKDNSIDDDTNKSNMFNKRVKGVINNKDKMKSGFTKPSVQESHIGFKKLEGKIEDEGKSKEAAGAIAASIGRKKYGAKKFAKMAHEGTDYKSLLKKKLVEFHEEDKNEKFHKETEKVEKELLHLEKEAEKKRKRDKEKHHKESVTIEEKLGPNTPIKKWIEDFQSSDDPRFNGKSPEKRREMAIAAYSKEKSK